MNIELHSRTIVTGLLVTTGLLTLANLAGIVMTYAFGHPHVFGLVPMFDFNAEQNIPVFFSTTLFMIAGILLWGISNNRATGRLTELRWKILAGIFVYLGIDEFVCIHELLTTPTKQVLGGTGGFLHFAWVIPYSMLALCVALYYTPFLCALPRRIRHLFILSGGLYIGGAIGFEMIGSRLAFIHGGETLAYAFVYTVEELLEMTGLVLFIHTLMVYGTHRSGVMDISITDIG